MNKHLYVISLGNEKYFVCYTDTMDRWKIFVECQFLFPFVNKHGPNEIIETLWNVDEFDIDKTVKKYMAKYGIDNVRGGSYQQEKLTDIQETVLKQELEYVTASGKKNINPSLKLEEKMRYFFHSKLFHCMKYYDTREEIKQLHDTIKNQKELYNNTHEKLKKILWFHDNSSEQNISYQLDKTLIEKIQHFYRHIVERQFESDIQNGPNRTIMELYHFLLPYFKHFCRILQENGLNLSDFTQEGMNSVFISHPEFVFDPFVYLSIYNSSGSFMITERKIDEAIELCKIFEGICYWCLNRIDEYEFDLTNIPENIKLKSEMVDSVYKFNLRWHPTNNSDKRRYSVEV